MQKNTNLEVLWTAVNFIQLNNSDFICLTDIAKHKNAKSDLIIQNWMRNRNTIEFLWLRETINNQNFKPVEFEGFKKSAWLNAFLMSPSKWIKTTNAIGVFSKSWKYGWTYAHKDIAIKFASRISVEFELYLIKEFQRLKEKEVQSLDRNVKRFLTKINYKIHTDAIKNNIVPIKLNKSQINFIYADEADILNIALFGQTSKQRKKDNLDKKGNVRDYATIEQLIVLANIESINAEYIKLWIIQNQRLELLNQTSITQMKSLLWFNLQKELWKKDDYPK